MKKLFLFLSISFSLQAQSDSLKVTFSEEKVEKFEKTTLIDEYEKAFGGNRVVKSGLRGRLLPNYFDEFGSLMVQYEQKLGHSFSIIASPKLALRKTSERIINLETRYYTNSKKAASNINGRFISTFGSALYLQNYPFLSGYLLENDESSFIPSLKRMFKEKYIVGAKFGTQFNNLLEFGITTGLKFGQATEVNPNSELVFSQSKNFTPFLSISSQLGMGFLFPKQNNIRNEKCEFLKCNYTKVSLLKLNLVEALYVDKYFQRIRGDIAYERKLGLTPISLNTTLLYEFTANKHFTIKNITDTLIDISLDPNKYNLEILYYNKQYENQKTTNILGKIIASSQVRYYVGQWRRLKNGMVTNNLNGLFIGAEYYYKVENLVFKDENKSKLFGNRNSSNLGWIIGFQTLTNKNIFFEFGGFFGFSWEDSKLNQYKRENAFSPLNFNTYVKLGLAK